MNEKRKKNTLMKNNHRPTPTCGVRHLILIGVRHLILISSDSNM